MSKFNKHLNSFISGELSPRMNGRTDLDQYGQGCQELLNNIVRSQGGGSRRPGSRFLADGWDDSNGTPVNFTGPIRLVPFRFSKNDGSVVMLSTNVNGLNSFGIAIWVPSMHRFVSPTFSLTSDFAQFTGWTSQAELDAVQFSQSGDVLTLVSDKNPPIYILRSSLNIYTVKDIWSLRDVFPAFNNRITYVGSNVAIQEKASPSGPPNAGQPWYSFPFKVQDATLYGTVSAAATTGTMTLTFSSNKPSASQIGTIIRLTKSGTTGFVRVVSVSGFTASVVVLKTLGASGTQDSWELQAYGQFGPGSWPKAVCFHDQRLWFANTSLSPNTLWASQVGDFTELMIVRTAEDANFSSLSADRPFSYALASNEVNQIQWMLSGKSSIFIGTLGAEWLGESSGDTILGPLNPNFHIETTYGSKFLQGVNMNGSIVFVDQSGQHLREFIYNRNEDAYRAVDLTYAAEHLFRKGSLIYPNAKAPEVKQVAIQNAQNNVLYTLDSNGMLHACSKERDYGTLAWSTMQFGGVNDVAGTPPKVIAVCSCPSSVNAGDEIYVVVQRYLNGTTKLYFERIGQEFVGPSLNETSKLIDNQPVYSDSAMMARNMAGPKFFSRFTSTLDADFYAGASGTGTGTGSPTASNGLVLTGGALKYVSYPSATAALVNTGTITIDITPNYSGTPAAEKHFLAISKSNVSDNNLISFWHDSATGLLIFTMKSFDSALNGGAVAQWSPTAGVRYRFTLCFDLTANSMSIFCNGWLMAWGVPTTPFTRDTNTGQFVVGTNYLKAKLSDFTVHKIGISTECFWVMDQTLASNAWAIVGPGKYALAFDRYITGVNHFYGAVESVGDGQYLGSVDYRTTQLSAALTNCAIIGFKYISRVQTMDVEAGSILGSAQGNMRRAHEITCRFERTVGAKVGYAIDKLDDLNFQNFNYVAGQPIPLLTGDITVKFPLNYDRKLTVIVQQEDPYPCNVTSIVIRGLTYD